MLLVLIGLFILQKIPVELTPDITLPSVTVSYVMGRAAPIVMEQEVTRKVEAIANQLRNVSEISSKTTEGSSNITISFDREDIVDFRMVELSELLSNLKSDLPLNVKQKPLQRSVPDNLEGNKTFFSLSITGQLSRRDLGEFARKELLIPINGIDGVGDVEISGLTEPVVAIHFSEEKLRSYNLSVSMVQSELLSQLAWKPLGLSRNRGLEISLVMPPLYTTIAELEQKPVTIAPNIHVPLQAIAEVKLQDYPVKSLRRVNAKPSITLTVHKETGADALILADKLYEFLSEVRKQTGEIELRVEIDNTKDLRRQLSDLKQQSR
jgi:multidrug efflux pump subunit AcrB